MSTLSHIPVLLEEVVAALSPRAGETYVDATAGLGGHACAVARAMQGAGVVVLCDVDPSNLERAEANVRGAAPGVVVRTLRANFAELPHRLPEMGVRADCLLADLGFASTQMDDPARGLSFQREGPLDMRLDPTLSLTASDLVNTAPEEELARIIAEYGEDKQARRIARKVVQARGEHPIQTTAQLAAVVRAACGPSSAATDPATRTFQALRIAVNDELGALGALLAGVESQAALEPTAHGRWLARGARVGFITFHSLEDRPVKASFASLIRAGATDLTGGPRAPSDVEVARNPRSRSAKLRAVRLA